MLAAPAINLPLVQSFHPATFLERGVAIPFTTPALASTRGRPAERGGLDLMVPNPSGGRGVYILGWPAVRQLCRPTVHDSRLAARLAMLRAVTPAEIRRAARAVLAEGLAGREAQAAAVAADSADRQDRLLANFLLLLALVEQVEPTGLAELPADALHGVAIEQRARRGIVRIAPRLGRTPEAVAAILEELATVFAGIGLPGQSPPARIPRLLAGLHDLRREAAEWSRRQDVASGDPARLIATAAELTLNCAKHALADAQGMTTVMPDLLRQWAQTPQAVVERLVRPEWLLDGWEPICLLWRSATTEGERAAALDEMATLVPVLPRETSAWMGMEIDTESVTRFRKTVQLNEDWRTGASFDRIARNERLRAAAA
jgi:hypothetical protein